MTEAVDIPRGRTIAIAGRPNVGKSALFNRIAGRRVSIVHEQSGVTRDRIMREVTWGDVPFTLIDTGGIGNLDSRAKADDIESGILSQAEAALEDAACIIMVADVSDGVVPLDEEVARVLRRSDLPVYLAVNKVDTIEHESATVEFAKLGFPIFPISALHNRGVDGLLTRALEQLPEAPPPSEREVLKVAVVGRPNAGKSSYLNRILRNDRVIVSEVAGTTRDSVDIPFSVGKGDSARRYVLTDTAGMRKKSKIDTAVERYSLMRAESSIKHADIVVHVIDATTGASAQGRKIASMVQDARKGYLLLFNKWDLMDETTQRSFAPEIKYALPFLKEIPVVFASTVSGYNIRKSLEAIDQVAAQIDMRIPTGVLNRAIMSAYERYSPPVLKGRRLKIYYSTQVGVRPVRIDCFVNDPKRVVDTYKKYLTNELRARFELLGAPLELRFKPRRKD